jgi:hypothetical protein
MNTLSPPAPLVNPELSEHRRQLTTGQLSMVAARVRDIYDRQAKERMQAGVKTDPVANLPQGEGKARDAAGKAVGVSGKTVDAAQSFDSGPTHIGAILGPILNQARQSRKGA